MSTKKKRFWSRFLVYIVLIIGSVIMVLPYLWMISTAFKTFPETLRIPIQWLPSRIHLTNFREVLVRLNFGRYYVNTIAKTVSVVALQSLTCSMAAFGFSRIKFPGRTWIFMLFLSMMMIPSQMTLLPSFVLLSRIGWVDRFIVLVVPLSFSVYGCFFLRQFFLAIPGELEESAVIDGASKFSIYARIFVPLSGAAFAAFGIFTIRWAWNDLMWPLIMTSRNNLRVLPVAIATLVGEYVTRNNHLMAAAMMSTLPLIIMFIFLPKHFIAGVATTGLKM